MGSYKKTGIRQNGTTTQTIQIVDLFCGIGGLTKGLTMAGFDVIAGFDNDSTCEYAYTHNNTAKFYCTDIRNITAKDVDSIYREGAFKILVGCAPCQPFSQMTFKYGIENFNDKKYDLLLEFGRIIEDIKPMIVSMENVPQLQKSNVFHKFIEILKQKGYYYDMQVVYCPDYGISQGRRRFVLLASLLGEIHLIPATHDKARVNVRSYIEDLPPIKAGEVCKTDRLHQSAKLSDLNLKRIRYSKPGGSWRDWPEELRCECHKRESGQTYSSVYGRMEWDKIGPTITTQFHCYGTGRYGHPEQDRALSLREGALLQTFPKDYDFIDPKVDFSIRDIARHIGNAVPVRLGEVIGISIKNHLLAHNIKVRRAS